MKLKNISGKDINVNGKLMPKEAIFEEIKSNEVKNLLLHKYLEEVK